MDLELVFRFSPPSAFGLPGDDFLVIPGGENGQKQIVSSTIDSVTGNQLLEGTLSSYREVGQGVNMEFVVGSYVGRLRDNVLFLTLMPPIPTRWLHKVKKLPNRWRCGLAITCPQ